VTVTAALAKTAAMPPPASEATAGTKVREMLARVSKARGLPILRDVPSHVLDRSAILARIREHVDKEVPRDAIENEGELLAALELVPPDYDFVEGTYKLIQGRIAGFYEPSDHAMYLVDDLTDEEAVETLAHELEHALQDQSFQLATILDYAPGEGDRIAAGHTLLEGDAMSAMLDVVAGSAFGVSEQALRAMIAMSNAMSDVGATTPHILQASLAAPYTDGFAFVQRLRTAGGWPAVDLALRNLPQSTEQLLHGDKYASREPPLHVTVPSVIKAGAGLKRVLDDVAGEQGLRLMLEEWTSPKEAERAAAGWGGDRYVIAREDQRGAPTIAVAWHLVMDTDRDGAELADVLKLRFGARCRERKLHGPIAWRRRGRDLAVVAGPYVRREKSIASAGSCAGANHWLSDILPN
jgi:hypothetical protein